MWDSNLLNPPSPFFSNPNFRHRWHSRNRECYWGGIGGLNILINNAERNIRIPVVDFTAAEFSTLMATNFESVFHISQLAYPKHCIHLLCIYVCSGSYQRSN
nr:tropinone reductase like, chloroplastic [Quercus suber]